MLGKGARFLDTIISTVKNIMFDACKIIAVFKCCPFEPIIIKMMKANAITPSMPFIEKVFPENPWIYSRSMSDCNVMQAT